ncbi:MAG: galactosyldiacylglycerol synthase [Acidobacteriia bacterium]|nr:galactosyldiacylglycerol synthase [Terriglobia bacterium]
MRPKIDFLYFNAGGGHRAAATALEAMLRQQDRPWQVRLVNLNDVLMPTDVLKKVCGLGLEDIYNLMLKKGWTLGSAQLVPVMHFLIRLFHKRQVELIGGFWKQDTPDLVVSVIPNFNRAILEGLRRCSAQTPMVTILTDLADYPPHFWLERQSQYVICGSPKAVEQARAVGLPPGCIYQTSGMILRPHFYDVPPVDRASERIRLGLSPDLPTGLVLFGGQGAGVMLDITRRLSSCGRPMQLILMCGQNKDLADKLRQLKTDMPMHVEGFTTEVPYFMQLADFFIGKPGPGSISEAIAMHLPVIVECNAWTLPQERYNAEWIRGLNVGIVLKSFRTVDKAVTELIHSGDQSGDQLEKFRQAAAQIRNRAIFEIPDLLDEILKRGNSLS